MQEIPLKLRIQLIQGLKFKQKQVVNVTNTIKVLNKTYILASYWKE